MMDHVKLVSRMQDKLYDELENYINGELKNANCLDIIDKLLHSIKSASTVLAMEGYEEGSSSGYRPEMRGTSRSYYNRGSGYDSGRSRGTDDEFMRHLMELRTMAPDERTSQEIQRMIDERR